jgi:hypothetical protein
VPVVDLHLHVEGMMKYPAANNWRASVCEVKKGGGGLRSVERLPLKKRVIVARIPHCL